MNRFERWTVSAILSMAILCAFPLLLEVSARAQGKPRPAPRRSFSNPKKGQATQTAKKDRKAPTQEQLTDAVLGNSLQLLDVQTERHFHEGEYNHMINLDRIIVQGDPHNMDAYATAA